MSDDGMKQDRTSQDETRHDAISKPVRYLSLLSGLALLLWMGTNLAGDLRNEWRTTDAEARIAAAEAEIARGGIQTVVFALG